MQEIEKWDFEKIIKIMTKDVVTDIDLELDEFRLKHLSPKDRANLFLTSSDEMKLLYI